MDLSEDEFVSQVQTLVQTGQGVKLEQLFADLAPNETGRAFADLSRDLRSEVMTLLSPTQAARIIESMSDVQGAEILHDLEPQEAAAVIGECLSEMDEEQAADVRARIEYSPSTAGGLMVTEFLQHSIDANVGEVIEFLRQNESRLTDYSVQYVFVVTAENKLCGVLRLRDLVLVSPDTSVASIMLDSPISVPVASELAELEDVFERHRFIGIPVVNQQQEMLGVVRRADVMEAVGERSESDYLKSSGILGGEELRTMPISLRSRRRLSWLSINIVLNLMAASVIAFYQETLQSVIVLAVFLPIISDMSGCSGSQAVAVSVRELALGLVKGKDMARVWGKEVIVGIINGAVLGLLIALVAWAWKGNPVLGLVVGVALGINTIIAVSIGGVVPLLLTKYKKDPALASGPILTTVTDMCGFFILLSLAAAFMPWLQ